VERVPPAPLVRHHHHVLRERLLRVRLLPHELREEEVLRALLQGLQACPDPG
jgi:hypothetical protein